MAAVKSGRRFIVVTGLSGAGKTVALNALEDLEFYCIDNLPAGMLEQFFQRVGRGADGLPDEVAVGIDARSPEPALAGVPAQLGHLRAIGIPAEIVFLDAADDVLVRRFSETLRRHPLSSDEAMLPGAISKERRLLGPLSEIADLRIDTSLCTVHELRKLVHERVALRPAAVLSLQFISFGYKFGVPLDADFVFDVRCLPNPHWEPGLRNLTGKDPAVADFLQRQPEVGAMLQDQCGFLDRWIPRFEAGQRSYLSVALGCTGGQHRSVYMAQWLAGHINAENRRVLVLHRDLG